MKLKIWTIALASAILSLSLLSCSGKAKQAKSASSPLVAPVAIETFPLDDLPFAPSDGSNDLSLNFRDVSTFLWPDPLTPEMGAKVLSMSRTRDENFEEKFGNEMKIQELENKTKNGPPELVSLRNFFDQQVIVQETKVGEQRAFALPQAAKNYTLKLAESGRIPRPLETMGEVIDFLNLDSDALTADTQALVAAVTNPGAKKNLSTKLNGLLKMRVDLRTVRQQLRDHAAGANYSPEIEQDFRATDAEIHKLKARNDSPGEGKNWAKWPIAQQNQKITEVIPYIVGLQGELMSYPEVQWTRGVGGGPFGMRITKFNPCFSGAEFANDLEYSTSKSNLYGIQYEPRGGVLSFAFDYDGPGVLDKEVPVYEMKQVLDDSGNGFTDRRGNPVIDFVPKLLSLRAAGNPEVPPTIEPVKKNIHIECFGGHVEVKVKRVRYAIKNQIIFQGDMVMTDRHTGKVSRGIFRLARDK